MPTHIFLKIRKVFAEKDHEHVRACAEPVESMTTTEKGGTRHHRAKYDMIRMRWEEERSTGKRQTAVTDYLSGQQLLLFVLDMVSAVQPLKCWHVFVYRPWRPMGFFNLKSSYVLVCSFWFIRIPMLWVCGHYKYFILTVRRSTLDVRIWRLQTSDSDDSSRSPHCKG